MNLPWWGARTRAIINTLIAALFSVIFGYLTLQDPGLLTLLAFGGNMAVLGAMLISLYIDHRVRATDRDVIEVSKP